MFTNILLLCVWGMLFFIVCELAILVAPKESKEEDRYSL